MVIFLPGAVHFGPLWHYGTPPDKRCEDKKRCGKFNDSNRLHIQAVTHSENRQPAEIFLHFPLNIKNPVGIDK